MTETNKRSCPYCKEDINPDATKCRHCGCFVAPEHPPHKGVCPHCKEAIHPDALVCKHCRSRVGGPIGIGTPSGFAGFEAMRAPGGGIGMPPPPTTGVLRAVCRAIEPCHWEYAPGYGWVYGRRWHCVEHHPVTGPSGDITIITDVYGYWESCEWQGQRPFWTYFSGVVPIVEASSAGP